MGREGVGGAGGAGEEKVVLVWEWAQSRQAVICHLIRTRLDDDDDDACIRYHYHYRNRTEY